LIYLAYTKEDAVFVIRLAEDLAATGIDLWVDVNEIGATADWSAAQQAAIEASEGVIVVVSPEAVTREHMRREIDQAARSQKPLYLAVARRSPWQVWFEGLPFADFTGDYDSGLNDLLINLMGGQSRPPRPPSEEARPKPKAPRSQPQPEAAPPQPEAPRRSIVRRLLRRP
jgi:hypothetical protein